MSFGKRSGSQQTDIQESTSSAQGEKSSFMDRALMGVFRLFKKRPSSGGQRPRVRSEKSAISHKPTVPHPEEARLGRQKKNTYKDPFAHNPWVSFLNGSLSFLFVLSFGILMVFLYIDHRFEQKGVLDSQRNIIIPQNSTLSGIAATLKRESIIESPKLFQIGTYMNKAQTRLKAGEYALPAQASMADIMRILIRGKVIQHPVTIPEGLTSQQIVQRLLENDIISGEVDRIPAEGALLPDTYLVTRGTKRADIVSRMVKSQSQALDEIWAKRNPQLPLQTKEELVVLASIVEKETGVASERPLVASVFVNRLKRGMRLQSDPTIIYGIVGGEGKLDRPITRADINLKTAYNTYQIDGLPPSPIANPGRAALEAVANPADSDYIFFVADGTGGHAFARTLEEHNRNVAKWREIERRQGQ